MKSPLSFTLRVLFCLLSVGLFSITQRPGEAASDYYTVNGPCNLEFPKDHGPHPGYRTEWWYYTGNLASVSGKHFGFQLTFFRTQISPPGATAKWPRSPSAWRTQQIYLAHSAVTDISGKKHLHAETVSREALKMAGALQTSESTTLFLKDWSARIEPGRHLLKVNTDEFSFDLTLTPSKPPVKHGQAGYSLKGSSPQRASCYYSYTRLESEGRLKLDGKVASVKGLSWMDHEFSTAPLEPGLEGWDWFSLQFSDQTEFMGFLLRMEEGDVSQASSGTFVDREGQSRHLAKRDFVVTVLDSWKSPHSKAVYPSRWRLQVFPLSLDVTIVSNLPDQEMRTLNSTGVTYWEGSVSLRGTKENRPLSGRGYVELTGYARSFDAPM